MIKYFQSELLKQKHRFAMKLLWIGPCITLLMVMALMPGRTSLLMPGAYNWWYTMILPGILAIIVSFTIAAEKKHNRHGLFAVSVKKEELWMAQISVNTVLLLVLNLMLYILVSGMCLLLGVSISYGKLLLASLVLVLTFMWQIPVLMLVSEKMGSLISIILCLLCNVGMGVFLAPTKLWYLPFAIPARLMCPLIKVQPNGLLLDGNAPLAGGQVVLPGIIITVLLYVVCTLLTALWFRHREVR